MSTAHSLCVALDGSDRQWITSTAESLDGVAGWVKLGLEAFTAHGPALVRELAATTTRLFLDLKLHDIPATVGRAAANCAGCGVDMITAHAAGGPAMLRAAVDGVDGVAAGSRRTLVIAVTLLTSLDDAALADLGVDLPSSQLVRRWARIAVEAGCDGVVCSALEARLLRQDLGPKVLLVTPGIRPAWCSTDDQRRVLTPSQALLEGADLLVVGRPITRAASPREAAQRVLAEMHGS